MKFAVLLLLFAVCCTDVWGLGRRGAGARQQRFSRRLPPPPAPLTAARAPVINWLDQKLDHFTPSDTRTWMQLYHSNDQYYTPGGPVFIFIGGEGPASIGWVAGGQMMELAQNFGAVAFQLEHRFYGQSRPLEDTSLASLRYLTTEQALADLAVLIREVRTTYADGKLIVFGGSYAGNLAAWAQLRYPHLVHGAVASSAPVLAQVDYPEYFGVVATVMDESDPECLSNIVEAVTATADIMAGPDGEQMITDLFNLCSPLDRNNYMDVSTFYSSFGDVYAGSVQYAGSVGDVGLDCALMTDSQYGATPLDRYIGLARDYLTFNGCFEHRYSDFIDYFNNTSWDGQASMDSWRQWFYQTCTEYGYYQTSGAGNQPFGDFFKVDYLLAMCEDFYTPEFNSAFVYNAVDNTNLFYGGIQPQVENVVFVNGANDPWHVLSVLEDLSSTVTSTIIDGASHCQDMYTSNVNDSPSLAAAKLVIKNLVGSWVAE